MANGLSQVGLLTFDPASALSCLLTLRCSQCQGRERPCVCEPRGYSRPHMCGRCQPRCAWHILLEISGESSATRTHTRKPTQPSPELYFLYLASFLLFYLFVPFITGLSKCTDAPYFTGSNYPSTPPLPAPHSAQIQKNSFHYCCVTKGHIRQCGVVSVSTDAFSGLTHPLAELCVPLSTCTAPPFLFPCGSPTLGIIFLCPQSSFPRRPSHLKP